MRSFTGVEVRLDEERSDEQITLALVMKITQLVPSYKTQLLTNQRNNSHPLPLTLFAIRFAHRRLPL